MILVPHPHLLHEDLRIIRHHIAIHHGAKGNVVAGRLNVLVHQLPEVLTPQAVNQVCCLCVGAANLPGQDFSVLQGLVVDGPAGNGCPTLGYGPVKQTWRDKWARKSIILLYAGINCSFNLK